MWKEGLHVNWEVFRTHTLREMFLSCHNVCICFCGCRLYTDTFTTSTAWGIPVAVIVKWRVDSSLKNIYIHHQKTMKWCAHTHKCWLIRYTTYTSPTPCQPLHNELSNKRNLFPSIKFHTKQKNCCRGSVIFICVLYAGNNTKKRENQIIHHQFTRPNARQS